MIAAALIVGCGEIEDESASETAPQSTVDIFAPPPHPEGEVDDLVRKYQEIYESLNLPYDRAESARWVREYVSIYEYAYETCGRLADFHSQGYDPSWQGRYISALTVTETARETSARAAWVAWTGCQDGMFDSPFLPELGHLRRNP